MKTCTACGQVLPDERSFLCDTARSYLEELSAEGIVPTWEDVCCIQHYAARVQFPDPPSAVACGIPRFAADDVALWPLTLQADTWLQWVHDRFARQPVLLFHATAYAMCHARVAGAFAALYNERKAGRAIEAWVCGIPCTQHELREAMDAVNRDTESEDLSPMRQTDDEATSIDTDEIVAMLTACCGETPEYWASLVSHKYLMKQLAAVVKVNAARSGTGRSGGISETTEEIRAIKNLAIAVARIKARHREAQCQNAE